MLDQVERGFYQEESLTMLMKIINEDLVVKNYRMSSRYEFLFREGKEIQVFSIEKLKDPHPNGLYLFQCESKAMNNNETMKAFRHLLCSIGFASYLNHEEIKISEILAFDDPPLKELAK